MQTLSILLTIESVDLQHVSPCMHHVSEKCPSFYSRLDKNVDVLVYQGATESVTRNSFPSDVLNLPLTQVG